MATYDPNAWRGPDGRIKPLDERHAAQLAAQRARESAAWHRGNSWVALACIIVMVASILARAYVPGLDLGAHLGHRLFNLPVAARPPIDWMRVVLSQWTFLPPFVTFVSVTVWRALRRVS